MYHVGDEPKLKVEIKDSDTNYVDPNELRLLVKKPSAGAATLTTWTGGSSSGEYTIQKSDTGRFEAAVDLTEYGIWKYRYESDSPDLAEEKEFKVRKQEVSE